MKTLKQFEGWGIMYNTYTIGELAKILGITAETIRYYERKGIIAPIHDQETGYRYYTTWDLHMLIRARCYLGFGLLLDNFSHQQIEFFRSQQEGFCKRGRCHCSVDECT